MKGKIIFFLCSIAPIILCEPSFGSQSSRFKVVAEGTISRRSAIMGLAQEIESMNRHIDQLIAQRETLKDVYEIASLLKYIDQLKKQRDTKMRELKNLRAQNFTVRKIG
jgi:hypothetical protein